MFRRVISHTHSKLSALNPKRFSSTTTKNATEHENLEKSINQVTLLGRVGANPSKRGTEQHPVVIFPLATHVNYKYENGNFMQRTDWHRISIFKPNLRDTVYSHLKKGQRVMVTGRLTYGEFKDDTGTMKPSTTVVAEDVIFFQTAS